MPSHQIRVRQAACNHIWMIIPIPEYFSSEPLKRKCEKCNKIEILKAVMDLIVSDSLVLKVSTDSD